MSTSLVAGRVSEECKERAAFYIRRAGLTTSDVIRIVWENIARTGEVPQPAKDEGDADTLDENPTWQRYLELVASTPRSEYLEGLTAADIRRIVRDRDDL